MTARGAPGQVLIGLLFVINGVEFVFFLGSDISRPAMQASGPAAPAGEARPEVHLR